MCSRMGWTIPLILALAPGCRHTAERVALDPTGEGAVRTSLVPVELEGQAPQTSKTLAVALPLQAALSFAASRSDSCSQSWATSHWRGQLTLTADAAGKAVLGLRWKVDESGGSWDGGAGESYSRSAQEDCSLEGRAHIEGSELVLTLAFPDRSPEHWGPYECQPRYSLAEGPPKEFTVRCRETNLELGASPEAEPSHHVDALLCDFGEQMPWLVGELVEVGGEGQQMLELADERLHVEASNGETMGGDMRRRWFDQGTSAP
ncbi:MAG: hypothetical protein KC431_31980 [Myxococcales bacterium]|nr:hypothetical protein [Myxococcales bacterium]